MNFYTKSVYAAVTRMQNPDIISPTDNDLYVMQSEICVNHLLDNHDNCWAEICWKVQNPELFLANTNLIGYTESQANALKEFLKKHTKLLPKQSLITSIRTSMNEAFNRVKLNYTDKKVDYAKSLSARHGLAVLHNDNGLLEMLEIVRRVGNFLEFSKEDEINIGRIWKQRENKSKCNVAEINKRNDLIPYGIKIKDNIINQEFRPSFANLIPDFDRFILCEGCKCFPKQSPKSLFRLCYFYNEHGLSFYIINSNYREFQRESIESFFKKQDTLMILPTEAEKTLIFSAMSILTKALTIVFIPLKAIMECQLCELIEMGIPATKIYAASDQPLEEQEKIFGEVAARITKVLPAWTKLGQIKDEFPLSPILLLTATCSCEGASRLSIILKRPNLKNREGRVIIYASTPIECIEIFNGLKEYVDSNHL
ncbi:22204_t:CDS:2, partial [Gigaspora rosea]